MKPLAPELTTELVLKFEHMAYEKREFQLNSKG